jgi:hypothetical protein
MQSSVEIRFLGHRDLSVLQSKIPTREPPVAGSRSYESLAKPLYLSKFQVSNRKSLFDSTEVEFKRGIIRTALPALRKKLTGAERLPLAWRSCLRDPGNLVCPCAG